MEEIGWTPARFLKHSFGLYAVKPKVSILWWVFMSALCFGPQPILVAQVAGDPIVKGGDGIMRWQADGREVTGFGINYTVPFAHAYRSGKIMGVDLRLAMEQDVYHFQRLGLDLFRVHVWDCEISDTLGNLIDNEHLELFDYFLYLLKKHNINSIITPIAFWGNGWPDPDEPTPGFSSKYGKDSCLTNPLAIAAQERYLYQFANHVNRYTGIAYKDEPDILAFEVSNEPHHRGTPEEVTAFIIRMKEAIRATGCTKPIFYNVSHSVHLAEAYFDAGIDGGTFQWYPTGLGFQKELGGNMLPNVDRYAIPFDEVMKKHAAARIVYEFDAADMASTYMYPAMARSFRTAGIQLATHFSYDPTFLAPFNTEYNTHYMNLLYAPGKALSLMLCAEVFRQIPLYASYGVYPSNTTFGPFRVSYEQDLAEMMTSEKFIHTNHTVSLPPEPDQLRFIAGCGNSPLVKYEGTGAYFLDRIGPGLWTLEVLPDVLLIDNLFGQNNLETPRAILQSNSRRITLDIPDLQKGIVVAHVNNDEFIDVTDNSFMAIPGKYLIMAIDFSERELEMFYFPNTEDVYRSAADFLIPALEEKHMLHQPVAEATVNHPMTISAQIASSTIPDSVDLWFESHTDLRSIGMQNGSGFKFTAEIPAEWMQEGRRRYWITTYFGQTPQTYPSGSLAQPDDWNFEPDTAFYTQVVPGKSPIVLFDAGTDIHRLNRIWLRESRAIAADGNEPDWLYIKITQLIRSDPENLYGLKIADYSIRHFVGDKIAGRRSDLRTKKHLVLHAKAMRGQKLPVQLKVVLQDGTAAGAMVQLNSRKTHYRIPLKKLKPVRAVLLPRPYPTFLPYYSAVWSGVKGDVQNIESIQVSVGPGLKDAMLSGPFEFLLGGVWLE